MRLRKVANAGVAQLAEQLFCKQRVGGSIPLAGFDNAIWKWAGTQVAKGDRL